jgi:organic radical activating enzyme
MNTQKPEHSLSGEFGNGLDVHSIFYTIQGEGPYSGTPAVFIRLAGCNMQCPECDTEYTHGRHTSDILSIAETVESLFPPHYPLYHIPLIVLTGGEPLRQNINKLLHLLIANGHHTQIETNGTMPLPPGFPVHTMVVCSPKGGKVHEGLNRITAFKYVLDARFMDEHDGLPSSVLGNNYSPARPPNGYRGKIYLSPMDVKDEAQNARNVQAAAESCMKHGYILNLQIHKYAKLP